MVKIQNALDIASWRLCTGCGACYFACPEDNIILKDVVNDGIRPFLKDRDACRNCTACLKVCPSFQQLSKDTKRFFPEIAGESEKKWGYFKALFEGYAAEEQLRFVGSSGGVVTALATYCLRELDFEGVLHVGSDSISPYRNVTIFSQNADELFENTGSRYSPASPCDSLEKIRNADRPCVFIGKPCDVSAVRQAAAVDEKLKKNIGLVIGIFCAGTPSTWGTLELLKKYNLDPKRLSILRYRGHGWPGEMTAAEKGKPNSIKLSYRESWGFLQSYRPIRCHLCPDGTSELADISCGDAWYRDFGDDDPGRSLILPRTEAGYAIINASAKQGYIRFSPVLEKVLEDSQINLLNKKRAIWGRLLAMKLLGIPVPLYVGYFLFENWQKLPLDEKIRSFVGTIKRILVRGYYKPKKWAIFKSFNSLLPK